MAAHPAALRRLPAFILRLAKVSCASWAASRSSDS